MLQAAHLHDECEYEKRQAPTVERSRQEATGVRCHAQLMIANAPGRAVWWTHYIYARVRVSSPLPMIRAIS
jgi:hypothetical protein